MKKLNTLQSLHLARCNRNPLMVLRSYGLMVFFLFALCFLPSLARADNTYYEIKQEYTVSQIQTELQALIDAAESGDTVFVTGSKTNADITLTLYIAKKIVVWQAYYQSISVFNMYNLITIYEDGTFEVADGTIITEDADAINATDEGSTVIVSGNGKVQTSGYGMNAITTYGYVEIKDNAQLSSTDGETIESKSNNAIVRVTGGTICATSENAIIVWGKNSKIFISGGHVYNDANGVFNAVYALNTDQGSISAISVSGTGKVEAKGMGSAIACYGNVFVSGDAQVSNTKGGDDRTSAIFASRFAEVSDNAIVSASNNYTIFSYGQVMVSGNSKIEAKKNAIPIYIFGEGNSFGELSVFGQAQVIAANNYAISYNTGTFSVRVTGGIAFAYGNNISDVINCTHFTGPTGSGIVLAWHKEAGNTNYERFSTTDLFIYPESATAHWDIKGGKQGISYANGENTGFIPIEAVTVLSVYENEPQNIRVYPNPTSGVLNLVQERIENGELRIENVEVFDVYGRKVYDESNSYGLTVLRSYGLTTDGVVINLTVLPAGIYFVKIHTEKGVVTKKVVKN